MPTVIGIIFFCLAAYCFLFKEEWLFGLLLVSVVFEAASAINFGERGIQSYYIVWIFVVSPRTVHMDRRWWFQEAHAPRTLVVDLRWRRNRLRNRPPNRVRGDTGLRSQNRD